MIKKFEIKIFWGILGFYIIISFFLYEGDKRFGIRDEVIMKLILEERIVLWLVLKIVKRVWSLWKEVIFYRGKGKKIDYFLEFIDRVEIRIRLLL